MTLLSPIFETKFSNEIIHDFSQSKSKFRPKCQEFGGIGSSTFKFPTISTVGTQDDKAPHEDLTPQSVDKEFRTCVLTATHCAVYLDDLEQLQTSANYRAAITRQIVEALNRKIDSKIEAALYAGGGTSVSVSAMDKAGLMAIAKAMNDADVDDEDRNGFVSNAAYNDYFGDTTLTSVDYMDNKALNTNRIGNVLGFNDLVRSNILVQRGGANTKRNYFFGRDSIGFVYGKDVSVRVERIAHKDSWQILGKILCASVVLRPDGVFYADIAN